MNLFTVLLKFTKSFGFLSFLWWWTLQSNPVFFEKAPFLHAFFFKLYTILVTEKNIFSFNVITTIMLLVSLYSHCLFFYLTFSGKGGLFCTSLFLFRTLVSMNFTSPSIILGSSVWSSMQSHNEHPQQPPLPGFHFMPVMSELCSQSVQWFWLVTISNIGGFCGLLCRLLLFEVPVQETVKVQAERPIGLLQLPCLFFPEEYHCSFYKLFFPFYPLFHFSH